MKTPSSVRLVGELPRRLATSATRQQLAASNEPGGSSSSIQNLVASNPCTSTYNNSHNLSHGWLGETRSYERAKRTPLTILNKRQVHSKLKLTKLELFLIATQTLTILLAIRILRSTDNQQISSTKSNNETSKCQFDKLSKLMLPVNQLPLKSINGSSSSLLAAASSHESNSQIDREARPRRFGSRASVDTGDEYEHDYDSQSGGSDGNDHDSDDTHSNRRFNGNSQRSTLESEKSRSRSFTDDGKFNEPIKDSITKRIRPEVSENGFARYKSEDIDNYSEQHDHTKDDFKHNQSVRPREKQINNANYDKRQVNSVPGKNIRTTKANEGEILTSGRQKLSRNDYALENMQIINDNRQICMTEGCVKAAAQALSFMDNSTNPCDDFYQYACGNWIKTNELIPDERATISVTSKTKESLDARLRLLLEKSTQGVGSRDDNSSDEPFVVHARNVYASCMNLTQIEMQGDKPLLDVLDSFGGWPVLGNNRGNQRRKFSIDDSSSSSEDIGLDSNPDTSSDIESKVGTNNNNQQRPVDWVNWLIMMRKQGFSHDILIDVSVVPDFRNTSRYIIDLDQGYLGLPEKSYYSRGLNDSAVSAYLRLMVDSAVALNSINKRQEIRRQMLEVLEFETSIARLSLSREQRRNVTLLYNKMTVGELRDNLAPQIDWLRFLNGILSTESNNSELEDSNQSRITYDTELNVKQPEFVRGLAKLLARTKPSVLANFMLWRVVRQSAAQLGKRWRELSLKYAKVLTGRKFEPPRWDTCIGVVGTNLEAALSALYVRSSGFDTGAKKSAEQMFAYIKAEFVEMLSSVEWMDEKTRAEAKQKALAMKAHVAFPNQLLDNELVNTLYSNLVTKKSDFFANVRALRIASTQVAFSRLNKENNKEDWRKHVRVAVVNAYYNMFDNSVELPAGILQANFFNNQRPNYMNYGAIGFVIGHEITHGFDDRGRQFDLNGNNRNWWQPSTDEQFKVRAKCIVDQYNEYVIPENNLTLNGARTQGENIADNGGIKQAFRAYIKWARQHGSEPRLPGLPNLSQAQLFWLSAGQVWCARNRPEALRLRLMAGAHSPNRFRVLGPLANLDDFAKAYKCPLGSAMNPRRKCSVW